MPAKIPPAAAILAIALVVAVLTLHRLGAGDVCTGNEAVEGVFVQQMVEHDQLLFPVENGNVPMFKPPLFHWTAVAIDRVAGICSLLTEPYRRDRCGEITAMYTLTRFQGEGVAAVLVREILKEAEARRLKYVFACTSDDRVAGLFSRLGFKRATACDVSQAKWKDYDSSRIQSLSILRTDLD